jgi:hypothetical protein
MYTPTHVQVNKERVQDAKGDNELDDGGFYKPTKSTLRAAPSTKTYRLPHVALAARFEKEIIGLWNSRFAGAFQYPVPRTIRGYYEKIRNPISLLDIRNRNGELIFLKMLCRFSMWLCVCLLLSIDVCTRFFFLLLVVPFPFLSCSILISFFPPFLSVSSSSSQYII